VVKEEVEKAGFKLAEEGTFLRNPGGRAGLERVARRRHPRAGKRGQAIGSR